MVRSLYKYNKTVENQQHIQLIFFFFSLGLRLQGLHLHTDVGIGDGVSRDSDGLVGRSSAPGTMHFGNQREHQHGEADHHDNMEVECQVHERYCSNPRHFNVAYGGSVDSSWEVKAVVASLRDVVFYIEIEANLEQPGALEDDSHAEHHVHKEELGSECEKT